MYNQLMPSYSEKINRLFYNWLLITFFMIFTMVIIGGLTRLTNSGLSITQWELFKGIFPPLNIETWNDYFSLYKTIPQFQLINSEMTLNEFKIIYYWEYFHRIMGRVIGLFFLIPFLYFYFTKKINKKEVRLCCLIFFLILFQGFVGWYMVKSGLVNNITVSHYRLSTHLSLAFIIISIIFWILLNLRNKTNKVFFSFKKDSISFSLLILLIFIQVSLGAFVSGLDAGRIYQTWPLMNQSFFPNDVLIKSINDFLDFNNHSLVQFYHRTIAYLITLYCIFIGLIIYKKKVSTLYKPFFILVTILSIQIFLGIITLLSGLNIFLALAHQICSLLLILSAINLYYYKIN